MKHSTRWMIVAATAAVAFNMAVGTAMGATIYVDGKLKDSCKGNYSVAARDASGKDGDAYRTICEAADIAKAGDTVIIREGTYNTTASKQENDALWPKNSGQPGKPITFKAKEGEKVVLGDVGEKYPGWDDTVGLAGAVFTFKGVSNIVVEGIEVRKVTGWLFARDANHITIRNCVFADGLHDFKGTARIIYCSYFRFEGCSFINSSGDCMQIEGSDRNVIENCVFNCAAHCLLAIRGSSYNVVRNCKFDNPFWGNRRPEHLTEEYDIKLDRRDPNSPTYEHPGYDSTKYDLWEHNFFGYMPFRPDAAAQPSAMQYSGQNGIVRMNVYCNPLDYRDANVPEAIPGGLGIAMRWGGSWDGWNANKKVWIGEGIEAGYVTSNRFFNNTFYGFDLSCVFVPADDVTKGMTLNPPPMEEANPPKQFTKKFEFSDNEFKNNIMLPGKLAAHVNWGNLKFMEGKPAAVMMDGLLNAMRFQNNDIFAGPEFGEFQNWLIYVHLGKYKYKPAMTPEQADKELPQTFSGNLQKDPMFVDLAKHDFQLKSDSPMIDAGAFLTVAVGAGKDSKELVVKDAGYFYDGFGIPGEKGDMIQIKGQKDAVRVVAVDYKTNTLTLEKAVSWADGDGVTLQYAGTAPDVGAIENGLAADQTIGPKTAK